MSALTKLNDEEYAKYGAKNIVGFTCTEPTLCIGDVKVVQQLYTTHNKYFDKHPMIRDFTMRMLGNSLLFADTNQEWRKRRTAMSAAFYKGKLLKLLDITKGCVKETFEKWKTHEELRSGLQSSQSQTFPFSNEMGLLITKVLRLCTLGIPHDI